MPAMIIAETQSSGDDDVIHPLLLAAYAVEVETVGRDRRRNIEQQEERQVREEDTTTLSAVNALTPRVQMRKSEAKSSLQRTPSHSRHRQL